MAATLRTLLVAAVLTVAIGLISGGRWPHFLMGAGFSLSLFVVLLFSTFGQGGPGRESVTWPTWTTFATASAITLVLGSVFLWIGGRDNGAWWGAAVIMAGSLMWPVRRAAADGGPGPG